MCVRVYVCAKFSRYTENTHTSEQGESIEMKRGDILYTVVVSVSPDTFLSLFSISKFRNYSMINVTIIQSL